MTGTVKCTTSIHITPNQFIFVTSKIGAFFPEEVVDAKNCELGLSRNKKWHWFWFNNMMTNNSWTFNSKRLSPSWGWSRRISFLTKQLIYESWRPNMGWTHFNAPKAFEAGEIGKFEELAPKGSSRKWKTSRLPCDRIGLVILESNFECEGERSKETITIKRTFGT